MSKDNRLLGQDRLQETLQKALSYSKADQTQVTMDVAQGALTRFANSVIHQNVAGRHAHIQVRAVIGKKIGLASGNAIDDDSIRQTVEKAVEFARHQVDNPDFVSLPGPTTLRPVPQTWFESTATATPEDRAAAVEKVVAAADRVNATAAGSVATSFSEQGIANSLGINVYNARTESQFSTVMTADTGYGYSHRIDGDFSKIDFAAAGEEAARGADRSRNPISIDPGEYDVILTPYAVSEMMMFLSWLGFSAMAVQEERSFMAGKFGHKVMGENISIWDDGYDPRTDISPFDREGVAKQKVELITNGIAKAVVYDSYTGNKEGKPSTGHSIGGTGTHGPYPGNLFLTPGDKSVNEMIASTERGIFVTRFNYTNVVHPLLVMFTGMTRDGTFMIENGKITKPVKNLRFTESILDALSNVEMIGKDLVRQDGATVPALKVKNFRFTGATEF